MTPALIEGSTVVDDLFTAGEGSDATPSKPALKPTTTGKGRDYASEFVATKDYTLEERPFFVRIGKDGVIAALEKLDQQLVQAGRSRVLSKKSPTDWTGEEVIPGRMGLINHGYALYVNCYFETISQKCSSGLPKVVTKAGRYPGFPLRNWWARTWCGTTGLSDTVIEFQGLTVVQVSQNQAAVVSDPQNHIFVIKNSGFVAFAIEGTYDVLSVVDMTHLPTLVKEQSTGVTLGWTHEVSMKSKMGSTTKEYVMATLFVILLLFE